MTKSILNNNILFTFWSSPTTNTKTINPLNHPISTKSAANLHLKSILNNEIFLPHVSSTQINTINPLITSVQKCHLKITISRSPRQNHSKIFHETIRGPTKGSLKNTRTTKIPKITKIRKRSRLKTARSTSMYVPAATINSLELPVDALGPVESRAGRRCSVPHAASTRG